MFVSDPRSRSRSLLALVDQKKHPAEARVLGSPRVIDETFFEPFFGHVAACLHGRSFCIV